MSYNGERFVMYNCSFEDDTTYCSVYDLKTGDIEEDEYSLSELYDIHDENGINIYGLDIYARRETESTEFYNKYRCIGEANGDIAVKVELLNSDMNPDYDLQDKITVEIFQKGFGRVSERVINIPDDFIDKLTLKEFKETTGRKDLKSKVAQEEYEEFLDSICLSKVLWVRLFKVSSGYVICLRLFTTDIHSEESYDNEHYLYLGVEKVDKKFKVVDMGDKFKQGEGCYRDDDAVQHPKFDLLNGKLKAVKKQSNWG